MTLRDDPLAGLLLYVSVGPNPRIVRMYAAERGLALTEQRVDLAGGENRRTPFLDLNPAGQLPALRLASGVVIAETVAICEYLDEVLPPVVEGPVLLGRGAEARALNRMWHRRIEEKYGQPVSQAFRYGPGLRLFASRLRCLPEAAEGMAALARDGEAFLNGQIAAGAFAASGDVSLAEIALYCFADFATRRAGLPLLEEHEALRRWFARMDARPSAQATHAMAYGLAG